jgi:hypothetical protein
LILVATSAPPPATSASPLPKPIGSASQRSSASTGPTGAQQPLVTLAAYLAAEPAPKGNATLVKRETGQARITSAGSPSQFMGAGAEELQSRQPRKSR